ncbi:MAG: hypothetical protein J6C75_04635 [Oscillospiraceae bacterium]|nr:hypothetical protein [Oscillospiraceae bacterium]
MAAKSGRAQFWIAFFMGIVILALPFSYALFKFSKIGEQPQPKVEENYYPQSSDSITLLVALKNDEGSEPDCFVFSKISPQNSAVTLAVFPPEILVEDAGSFQPADEVWDDEGAKRGATAIENAVGIEADRWLELDSQAIVRLGDVAGAVDMTLEEQVSVENGLLTLPAQRQLIDGTRAALLMSYDDYSGGEQQRLEMVAKLAEQFIYQRLPLMNEHSLLELFETAVNNGSSDLVIGDFETRRRAFSHMTSADVKVILAPVSGEYSDNNESFLLSSQCLSQLKQEFS